MRNKKWESINNKNITIDGEIDKDMLIAALTQFSSLVVLQKCRRNAQYEEYEE